MSRYREGDDPVFDAMIADVVFLRRTWTGPHFVAHRDEDTHKVTFHVHVIGADLDRLYSLLGAVPVTRMKSPGGVVSHHFHGTRKHMNVLLAGVR